MRVFLTISMMLCSMFCCSALGQQSKSAALSHHTHRVLHHHVQSLLSSVKAKPNIGVMIVKARTGKIVFSHHADFLFTPASVQKLFTAVAALTFLKPQFHFKTQLLTDGRIQGHTLKGDLIVRFTGDPELTTKNVVNLLAQLKQLQVKRITGHLYIDNLAYDNIPYPPGWMWGDLSYGYAAPLNAIIIDRNKFLMQFVPAKHVGHRPRLYAELPAGVIRIINHVKTASHYDKHCPLTIYSSFDNDYYFRGCLNRAFGVQRRTLAMRDPVRYAKALIRQSLTAMHVKYNHNIRLANRHFKKVAVLATHRSVPLQTILIEMLKNSDNLTTDSLLKKLGEQYYHQPGNWQNGLHALEHVLAKATHIDFKHILINDGAGLSRYNLLTPHDLVKLLLYADHHAAIRRALLRALPIAGRDGTLIERMRSIAATGRVRAKTGSMTGVSSLAGFIRSRHQGLLLFAIMVNGFVGKELPYAKLEDRICIYLLAYRDRQHG